MKGPYNNNYDNNNSSSNNNSNNNNNNNNNNYNNNNNNNFTIKVNVKKQRRFDRSTVILKLKSEKFLNALKYIQTIIKMLIRYWLKL